MIAEDLSICTDCLMIIANDDDSGIADPNHREHMTNFMGAHYPVGTVVPGDAELGFCTSACDCCGNTDHGDRHSAHLLT